MKLDVNNLYIVFKATPYSSEKDVFSGAPLTIEQFATKLKRGLDPKRIEGIYPSKRAAKLVSNKLLKKVAKSPLLKSVKGKNVTKGYTVFSDSVMAKHKYSLTTPPSIVYASRKQARASIIKWEKQYGKKSYFKIMTYDKSR